MLNGTREHHRYSVGRKLVQRRSINQAYGVLLRSDHTRCILILGIKSVWVSVFESEVPSRTRGPSTDQHQTKFNDSSSNQTTALLRMTANTCFTVQSRRNITIKTEETIWWRSLRQQCWKTISSHRFNDSTYSLTDMCVAVTVHSIHNWQYKAPLCRPKPC